MQKVRLPREVAEALDQIKSIHKYPIRAVIEKFKGEKIDDYPALSDYFEQDRSRRIETIMEALVNDYEIEETPEDKVREYFRHHYEFGNDTSNGIYGHVEDRIKYETVLTVLEMLNIKIDGVNTNAKG